MAVTFELPTAIESDLRLHFVDLNQTLKELALVELYRMERITQHQLGLALGLGRYEVDGLLKKHNVTEDLLTAEEYDAAMDHLKKVTSQ